MTQKKVSRTSSNGPPRNYRGALEVNLKTCAKGTKLRVYRRVCVDYRKLNAVIRKDHFPLPFIDQVLERVSGDRKSVV